ncbi:MAG TPA: DUF3943 domain-containing protein [Thermoanaerobaculia bacterium]|nr:DUF3943 domain-containing protein [Thermoanaerobaculia bacterium]
MRTTGVRMPLRAGILRSVVVLATAGIAASLSAQTFSLHLDGALAEAAPYPSEAAEPAPPSLPWLAPPPEDGSRLGVELLPPDSLAGTALEPPRTEKRFWLAAVGVALTIALPWIYDRYITNADFSHISWSTVSRNFKAGFGFDSDHFNINQSAHPYQGSFFFEAGRSNGYSYWESGLFALAGSFIWECCMENTRPSTNDLVNTTLGGMTRGEVQHRLAQMILDNTATGSERFWREVGAGIVNPMGLLTRLVTGDSSRQFENPDDRFPDGFNLTGELGYRRVEGNEVDHPDQFLASLSARYGDPFVSDVRLPFEYFTASIDLDTPSDVVITRFEERGILRSWELTEGTASSRHVFAFSQEYEYINNQAQVFGAQMFSAGFLSRYSLGRKVVLATDVDGVAIALAGVKTTNFVNPSTGRNYDYGPGAGALAALRLYAGENQLANVGYGFAWVHTVNGTSDENYLQFFRASATVPITGPVGVGAGYRWYSRKTTYPNGFFEPRQTQSEWRVFLSLSFGASGLRTPKV